MKHYVRLCRPRFDIAVIEVDEDDTDSAICAALAKADRGVNWDLMPFDPDVYTPHG